VDIDGPRWNRGELLATGIDAAAFAVNHGPQLAPSAVATHVVYDRHKYARTLLCMTDPFTAVCANRAEKKLRVEQYLGPAHLPSELIDFLLHMAE
jgi:hypothetical protein